MVPLMAEMKLQGRSWPSHTSYWSQDGATQLEQTAAFIPKGLTGLAYWYALYPFHSWIFGGLVKAIATRAERLSD